MSTKSRTAPNSNTQADLIRFRTSLICSVAIFACLLSPAARAQKITVNDGSTTYTTIANALAACPSPNTSCLLTIFPPGISISSTVALSSSNQNITIQCVGDGFFDYVNTGTRGPTTITWTGGASAMFTSNSVIGFTMRGCDINNTGSATEFFNITHGFYHLFDRVTVSEVTTPFATDAISCQAGTQANAFITIKDSLFLNSAPIEVNCDRVNKLKIENTELGPTAGGSSSTAAVQVGSTTQSYDFSFDSSSCDIPAGAAATATCLNLMRLEGGSIIGSYCEVSEAPGTAAGQLCVRMENAVTSAVHMVGNRFDGDGVANYGIETNGAPGAVIEANSFDDFQQTTGTPPTAAVDFLANANDTILRSNVASGAIPTVAGYNFTATTPSSIGGTALTAGQCASGTVTVSGAAPGMPVSVSTSDGSFLGGAFNVQASVTSSNTVTINVCAVVAGTPAAKNFIVNVN